MDIHFVQTLFNWARCFSVENTTSIWLRPLCFLYKYFFLCIRQVKRSNINQPEIKKLYSSITETKGCNPFRGFDRSPPVLGEFV